MRIVKKDERSFSNFKKKIMKKIILLLLFVPIFSFSVESKFLCSGEEIKSIKGDLSTQRVFKKVIVIQVFQQGMRLDGNWFDNNNDIAEDYLLEKSYLNKKDKINAQKKFFTSALIEKNKIQTTQIDKVEINFNNNNILWEHEFNRINITENKKDVIYAFKKSFKGACKEQ